MGLLGMIDAELQKDLIDFIRRQEEKPYPHTPWRRYDCGVAERNLERQRSDERVRKE